jgi:hypothetical protein
MEERPRAEVGEHTDGDCLFAVASRTAQDDRTVFPESGANIIEPVRGDERIPYQVYVAPGQAAKPHSLRPTDQEYILVAPYRIALYGQAFSFPQVFVAQRPLARARSGLGRSLTGSDPMVFRLRLTAIAGTARFAPWR